MKPMMEFHVSRRARDRYRFAGELFSLVGNVLFADLRAARLFAEQMNRLRDRAAFPDRFVRPGDLFAMGLIDEILHYVAEAYRGQVRREVVGEALGHLEKELGKREVDGALRRFVEEFPPLAAYRGEVAPETYLQGSTSGIPHREVVLEEMLLLWLANENPAFGFCRELFDDAALVQKTKYPEIIRSLGEFFGARPKFGPDHQSLVEMLRSPAVASPHSLAGQLEYIRRRWGHLLGGLLARIRGLDRLLAGLDLLREEAERPGFGGPGPVLPPDFSVLRQESERFSPDRDWMPRLVLLAKNTHVWLVQLSREHRKRLTRLDEIPDEELDRLASRGFTGLWLIGVWERSEASRRVKQMAGNAEAEASAYSLHDYVIASDLGGEAALRDLRDRAWRRGIRLASDMVPNHVGIDSRWVIEHPEWFISTGEPPFPAYRFTGPDLARDDRVGIFLEDHYLDRSDAAVVFKRIDRRTGSVKYIYHGNDGTLTPWNDTAQLNYLLAEVREAVIRTILHVARQFPIIRFDAAMTLTKQHYQRLWFPEPGTGGAIPSRAERGLTRAAFESRMPEEFWRQVVDRVAAEAPDTLLLAEAFWLLEGYFVRTLGMHRVYNSAFMNMLRDEDNGQYRSVIKNTVEFDPEILKRYVNFMNNPDEKTAVEQFGKEDKYFGVCTMMTTLPGLPMFGHGQIEGLTEKYGMEFRRPRWEEDPDPGLIERHEREIFPLLRRRLLFAGVENFRLYDFYLPEGRVSEDVFAYSNRSGAERGLVVFHNRFASARGWIRTSAAFAVKEDGGGKRLVTATLGEGLGLRGGDRDFAVFRDHRSGLEFIRSSRGIREEGLELDLGAYRCHVFLDFREVQDSDDHPYARLAAELGDRGVPSIEEALRDLRRRPVLQAARALLQPETLRRLLDALEHGEVPREAGELLGSIDGCARQLATEIQRLAGGTAGGGAPGSGGAEGESPARAIRVELETLLEVEGAGHSGGPAAAAGRLTETSAPAGNLGKLRIEVPLDETGRAAVLGWLLIGRFITHVPGRGMADQESGGMQGWTAEGILGEALREAGLDAPRAEEALHAIRILGRHAGWVEQLRRGPDGPDALRAVLIRWLSDPDVREFLRVNRYGGVLWFNKESFERLVGLAARVAAVAFRQSSAPLPNAAADRIRALGVAARSLLDSAAAAEYRLDEFIGPAALPP